MFQGHGPDLQSIPRQCFTDGWLDGGAGRAGVGQEGPDVQSAFWQVISDKYWTVALDGLVVGEKGITGINATGAIMDTGTSLITASDDDALLVNSVRSPCAGRSRKYTLTLNRKPAVRLALLPVISG